MCRFDVKFELIIFIPADFHGWTEVNFDIDWGISSGNKQCIADSHWISLYIPGHLAPLLSSLCIWGVLAACRRGERGCETGQDLCGSLQVSPHPRSVEKKSWVKELDSGVYCLHFVLMVLNLRRGVGGPSRTRSSCLAQVFSSNVMQQMFDAGN